MPLSAESKNSNQPSQLEKMHMRRLAELRSQLTELGITYFGVDANACQPAYRDAVSFEQAMTFSSYFFDLLSPELTEQTFCDALTTKEGLSLLKAVIQEKCDTKRIVVRDRDQEVMSVCRWMLRDSEIAAWLARDDVTREPAVISEWDYDFEEVSMMVTLWYRLLNPASPYRAAVLRELNFSGFYTLHEDLIEYINVCITHRVSPETLVMVIDLMGRDEELTVDWSLLLMRLDELSKLSGFRMGGHGAYEHVLAQAFFDELDDPGAEFLPLYLTYGRAMAFDARTKRALSPHNPDRGEALDYMHVDDQESEYDPRYDLLPLIGIEIEADFNPVIHEVLYGLLEFFVVAKGYDGDFEYSARPVRHAETLKLLYEKLLEAGFIDLFETQDYSTHWNANLTDRSLYVETLSGLALTGFFTDGRVGNSLAYWVNNKRSESGQYHEWKQGDLHTPEQLLMSIDIFHAVVTAQKNYEAVTHAVRINRRRLFQLNTNQGRVLQYPEMTELLTAPGMTKDQIALAVIFHEHQAKMRQVFELVDTPSDSNLSGYIQVGSLAGTEIIHGILQQVYSEADSLLENDPATYQITGRGPKNHQVKIAHQTVAAAQAVATETLHRVQQVLAECYFTYLDQLLIVATSLQDHVTAESLGHALQRLTGEGINTNQSNHLVVEESVNELQLRLEYGLRQTAYTPEQLTILQKAWDALHVYFDTFRKELSRKR